MKKINIICVFVMMFFFNLKEAEAQSWFSKASKETKVEKKEIGNLNISQTLLLNQYGQEIAFQEFIKDKVVAINFIFTKCKTICPPLGAAFSSLARKVNQLDPSGEQIRLISISIDPKNDTPQRLKKWSENFGAPKNWTLFTGQKNVVDQLLKDLKVYTPLKEDHAPIILMGHEGKYNWTRSNGLAPVETLYNSLEEMLTLSLNTTIPRETEDLNYFSDTELIDQNGEHLRFYSDLLKNKIVIINPFFIACKGSCPKMHQTMRTIQAYLGDRLDSDVNLLSITVDPINDTPQKLTDYAASFEAQKGWHFLSGTEENINTILKKLGKFVENRENHDTIFLVGNTRTRLWKKVNGLESSKAIIDVINSVLNDQGI